MCACGGRRVDMDSVYPDPLIFREKVEICMCKISRMLVISSNVSNTLQVKKVSRPSSIKVHHFTKTKFLIKKKKH